MTSDHLRAGMLAGGLDECIAVLGPVLVGAVAAPVRVGSAAPCGDRPGG